MSAYSRRVTLAAYQSVATHGGVAAADPHRLVLMLMDGALERLAQARGSLTQGIGLDQNRKNDLIHASVSIIEELRASLDLVAGGTIAAHLDDLYDYMTRQLVKANLQRRPEIVEEIRHLLNEIRSAWIALPAGARALRPAAK
jgi:flagellar protein FliS